MKKSTIAEEIRPPFLALQNPDPITHVYLAGPTLDSSPVTCKRTNFRMQLAQALNEKGIIPLTSELDGFSEQNSLTLQQIIGSLASNSNEETNQKILAEIIRIMDYGHLIPQAQLVAADCDFPVSAEVIAKCQHALQLNQRVIGYRKNPDTPPWTGDTIALMNFIRSDEIIVAPAHSNDEEAISDIACKIYAKIVSPNAVVNRPTTRITPAVREIISQAQKLFSGLENLKSITDCSRVRVMEMIMQNYLIMMGSNKVVRLNKRKSSKPVH